MYLFICEGIPYFIRKDCDTYLDYCDMAEQQYSCEHETDAIRRHLYLQLGFEDRNQPDFRIKKQQRPEY